MIRRVVFVFVYGTDMRRFTERFLKDLHESLYCM